MPSKYKQGKYIPKNPKKYIGNKIPMMRSSWEFRFSDFCDNNPNILEWASEPLRIPYKNLVGKKTTYVPDFIIRYKDNNNKIITELIEIKPKNQSILKEGMNPKLKATVMNNHLKWEAARRFCKAKGIAFRIVTEDHIFKNGVK